MVICVGDMCSEVLVWEEVCMMGLDVFNWVNLEELSLNLIFIKNYALFGFSLLNKILTASM